MKQIVVLLFLSVLAGCAAPGDPLSERGDPPEPRGSDCIFEGSVRDYRALDDRNLVVTTTGKRKYHIQLSYGARGLSSAWGLGFSSRTGQVCPGDELYVKNGFDADSVRIYSIRAIDENEYENLLVRHGKKVPEQVTRPPEQAVEGAEVEALD